jgi:hypothetical protein
MVFWHIFPQNVEERLKFIFVKIQKIDEESKEDTNTHSESSDSLRILGNLPREFIKISKNNNTISFTTAEFEKIDKRIIETTYLINEICQKYVFLTKNVKILKEI